MNRISSPDHSRAADAAAAKPIVDKGRGLHELALFAGAGGGILGGKLLGWKTICAVEIDPHAARVLAARQNDGCLPPFPIWDDIRSFDGRPWRGLVDVVSGGFPCQDISAAGRRAGIEGKRSGLWREMARIIREVGPRYAFVENSPMLTVRGLGTVLRDLAALGYDARWCVLGAIDAGAPHLRERIWMLADADGDRWQPRRPNNATQKQGRRQSDRGHFKSDDMADPHGPGSSVWEGFGRDPIQKLPTIIGSNWWKSEPRLGRMADGVADRMDRLKAIGNGQVPAVAALAWQILTEDPEFAAPDDSAGE